MISQWWDGEWGFLSAELEDENLFLSGEVEGGYAKEGGNAW